MAVNYDPQQSRFVADTVTIGHPARTESDRRLALDECLNNHWSSRKIGCLEREENSVRWGWKMFTYRAGHTGPPND
jgi:hypothetical protein